MKHLDVEEIARFAEGNIDKTEHERFLKHIANCEDCRKAYSAAFKFVEEEKANKRRLLVFPKIKIPQFLQSPGRLLANKKLRPAFAAVILIAIMVPFLFNIFSNRSIYKQQIGVFQDDYKEIDYKGFDAIYPLKISAVRAGIFIEDLFKVIEFSDKERIPNILHLLRQELKNIFKEKSSQFFPDPVNIGEEDLKKVVQAVTELENKPLFEVFQFGRFVEKTIFNSFEEKRADQGEVEKYLKIAEKYRLHQDVIENLKKVNRIADNIKYRKTWIAVRNAFKYSDYRKTGSEGHPMAERAFVVFERVKNAVDKKEARQARLFIINARIKLYAIAVPDGRIIINPETLNICYSGVDNEKGDCRLAVILGHELAHLANKDFRHRAAFLAWEKHGNITAYTQGTEGEHRKKELKADELGALYAAIAGYDIHSLFAEQDNFLTHWERQISREDIHRGAHGYPSLKDRVAAVRMRLKKVAKNVELFRAGVLLLQMGNFEDARAAFIKFEKDYKAREVYNNIGACHFNSAQYLLTQKFRKEYLRFRLSTVIDYSTSAERFRGHGTNSEKDKIRKYLDEAITNFKEAAGRDKIDRPCRYNLSAALILRKKYAEAREVCNLILAEDPGDANALNNKAVALYLENEKDQETIRQAIGLLEKAYRSNNRGNLEVLYNLGTLKQPGAGTYWEKYLKLPSIPRDDFYDHVYQELKGTDSPLRKTIDAPELPAGFTIGMDFADVEMKLGKENTRKYDLDVLLIHVLVKDNIRVVALEGEVVIIEKELSTAEKIGKLLEKYGPPQRIVRHSSGNFYIYENQGFSIKEVNGNARSYIRFEKEES